MNPMNSSHIFCLSMKQPSNPSATPPKPAYPQAFLKVPACHSTYNHSCTHSTKTVLAQITANEVCDLVNSKKTVLTEVYDIQSQQFYESCMTLPTETYKNVTPNNHAKVYNIYY